MEKLIKYDILKSPQDIFTYTDSFYQVTDGMPSDFRTHFKLMANQKHLIVIFQCFDNLYTALIQNMNIILLCMNKKFLKYLLMKGGREVAVI